MSNIKLGNHIFDYIPDKKVAWSCFNWVTNVCEVRNKIDSKSKEKVCHQCQKKIAETINDPILENMDLHNFLTLSIEKRWEFLIKHKIRRTRIIWDYIPDKTNKFAKKRSMNRLEREDLTTWEIYFTFNKYLDYLQNKHVDNKNIWTEKDQILSLLKYEKQISEYFKYNTRNRDSSEKWLNFQITESRPENTTFAHSLDYGKISDIHLRNNQDTIFPINKIPQLTIKNKGYNKLSEQIKDYINNSKKFEEELNMPFWPNKHMLLAYIHIVEQIEWACESNNTQAKSYVQYIFNSRKDEREKKMSKIISIDNETKNTWNFEIAPHKRVSRAVEKIIIAHDGNINRSTDNCRWTIIFNTIWDLQKWMMVFIDCLREYNNTQNDNTKKVTEVYFEDKFWNLIDFWKKASWYRDWKFLIKLWDGNVVELMLQLEDMYIAKNEWFDYIYWKSMSDTINKLKLNEDDLHTINCIIDSLDPAMSKRWKTFFDESTWNYNIPHIENTQNWDRIPADLIYNIYRNLEEYNRDDDRQWRKTLPFEKTLDKRSTVEKLQLLEREIYQRGYKQHSQKIHDKINKQKYTEHNLPLKNKIIK